MPKFVVREPEDERDDDDDEGADYVFDDEEPKSRDNKEDELETEENDNVDSGNEEDSGGIEDSDSEDSRHDNESEDRENDEDGPDGGEKSEPVMQSRIKPERRWPEPKPKTSESGKEETEGQPQAESEGSSSAEPDVPKEYADKWYKQAVGCCKRSDWPSAVNAVKELFDIVPEEERTAKMYAAAAAAACKTLQFKKASEYAKQAWALEKDPTFLNVRAMIYIDKYKADLDDGNEPDGDKYLKRVAHALETSVKTAEENNDNAVAGEAAGLYAQLYYLMGDEERASVYAKRGRSLKDPWENSERVLNALEEEHKAKESEPKKGTVKQNVMTVVGIVLFVVLALIGVYFIYLNSRGYGNVPTLGLVGLATAAAALVVSTVSLTIIWAANVQLRKHGAIPVVVVTVLNFLCWAAVLAYVGIEYFM